MAGYGRMAWDEGQRYVEQDKRARVPMRDLIGRAGDVPARPKATQEHNQQPSAARQFIETSLSQLARIPRELPKNLTELAKQYGPGAVEMAAQSLPGAGYAQSFQDYGNARTAFQEGSYGQAAVHGLQGVANQVLETVAPAAPTITAAGAFVPKAKRAAPPPMGHNNPPPEAALPPGPPPLTHSRISGRMPTAKTNVTEDPLTQDLVADVASMRKDPEYFAKQTENLRPIVPEKIMSSADPEEKWGAAQALMTANLDELYKRMDPEIARRSTLWYPGGRELAERLGKETGVPVESAAGAIAALSPQKNWFENVDLAQRTLRSLAEDPIITREMAENFRGTASKGYATKADALDQLVGKRLSEIKDPQQAALGVVAHDFHTRPRSFQNLSPEGLSQGLQLVGKPGLERPANVAWQSTNAVGKAVSSFRSGGDTKIISPLMGEKNKVRNFYNDVVAPDRTPVTQGQTFQDYTNDTHNIAGSLLRPLGSADKEVEVGLGLTGGASSKVGMGGLYGLYADAGREVAERHGVAPSQMQSPTWEAIRSLYPSEWKTQANKDMTAELWRQYRAGERSMKSVQDEIFRLADEQGRNVNTPPWLRGGQ